MSWKLLSTVWNVVVFGSNTAAWVSSVLFGNAFVSVDDHVSTRPSASAAAEIAMCGHAITGPQDPKLARDRADPRATPLAGIARMPPPGGA